ncbi:MAG: PEP-CTERM sorting domain-containing protein [Phycisphaerae bacterium]|nr:PEP-CTERM sorting domain-containing protein [Phycisphaerae bacterium]
MKNLKIITLAVGLILVVNATAGAITFNQSYNGPITIKFKNYDTGVGYAGGVWGQCGIGVVDGLPQLPAKNAWDGGVSGNPLIPIGPYVNQAEDAWLTVKVTSVTTAGGTELWSDGDGSQEVVGMMYGLVDVAVGGNSNFILSDGFFFDLYEQDAGQFDPNVGTVGRLGFGTYTGVGGPGGATGAQLIFSANSVPGVGIVDMLGIDPGLAATPQFSHRFTGIGNKADMYLDIDRTAPGAWNNLIVPVFWPDNSGGLGGAVSDLYSEANLGPNAPPLGPVGDWDILSDDPTSAYYVPEPMTMTLLLLGVGSLGGYIRKRRVA